MRYRFIDEIVSVVADPPRIEVAKTFAPTDDAFSGPAGPDRVPASLVIELLAMTGGQLLFRHLRRERLPLLLKVEDLRFGAAARPGDRLTARAALQGKVAAAGTMAQTVGEVLGDRGALVASGRFFYLCVKLPEGSEPGDLVPTAGDEGPGETRPERPS
jgi:3-hydroxymyristoyl/3-hydroxydecanoyl-(acyl carrier protein) dehydratase